MRSVKGSEMEVEMIMEIEMEIEMDYRNRIEIRVIRFIIAMTMRNYL